MLYPVYGIVYEICLFTYIHMYMDSQPFKYADRHMTDVQRHPPIPFQ